VREATLSEDSLITAGTAFPLSVAGTTEKLEESRILRVGPEFFRTMQIPMLACRDIEVRDGWGSPAVAVVNEAFIRANLAGRNPLGRTSFCAKRAMGSISRVTSK
jgi:hypothetical protein